MNDLVASWSLPWHEVQRGLAAGIGVAALGCHVPINAAPMFRSMTPSTESWLVRAHARAKQHYSSRKITAA
ncbi:MAG: hypothetical protein M3N50_07435 [Pseudomonadota bacterium]|nr:hypothetical protein [Pseudomonadota bacterium]